MTINLTRFYIDTEIRGADFKYRVIEDVETAEADEFEAKLKEELRRQILAEESKKQKDNDVQEAKAKVMGQRPNTKRQTPNVKRISQTH
jgi:hypothetical protein